MPPDPASDDPPDLQALVCEFLDAKGEERERAAARLTTCIELLAERVARAFRGACQLYRDFLDNATSHVIEKLTAGVYDRAKPFEPWCNRVLKNLLNDFGRRRNKERLRVLDTDASGDRAAPPPTAAIESADPAPYWPSLEAQLVAGRRLSERDVAKLEATPSLRRVTVLAASGVWVLVLPACWQRWFEQEEIEPPFPPTEILAIDEPRRRLAPLAEAMGMEYEAVRSHWNRGRHVLAQLDCFCEGEE